MALGLSGKLTILPHSPLDATPLREEPGTAEKRGVWVPSRFNVRAVTDDGRLVVWNSLTGAMSVFRASQRSSMEALLSRKGFEAKPTGIVEYLLKRGFLVQEGTDELRRVRLGFGQQQYRNDILQLILLASEDCNFRCQYCYEDFARGTMQPWVRTGIKKLVAKRAPKLRSLSISWFGGEPLYGFAAIEDLAPFFIETADEHSLAFSSRMTTNGYLLTPEVAERLLAWRINGFQITLDGIASDHDRNRPTRDGEGTFAVIFENLKSLRQRSEDYEVDIRINFDRNNHSSLRSLLDDLEAEFGGDPRFQLRFRAVGQWGGPNDSSLDVCGRDESKRIQMEMKAEARRRGLRLSDDAAGMQQIGGHVCYAARPYNFIVGATGKLMKCTIELDKKERNVVGELSAEGELLLNFDRMALWTDPAFESDAKCQKCTVLPVCQGISCPLVRFETNDSPCIPSRLGAKQELRLAAETGGRRRVRIDGEVIDRSTAPIGAES